MTSGLGSFSSSCQYERKDYRSFIQWLEIAEPVTHCLELKRIPHYTSLQKATARLDSIAVRRIIGRFVKERDSEAVMRIVSIDSTGYSMEHASKYYQTRLTYKGKERDIHRRHLKSTISIDTETLMIIAVKNRRGPASDHWDFHLVARSTHRIASPDVYVADKGFDAERHHALVRDELNALSIIPASNQDVPVHRTRGKYRKQMKRGYDKDLYNQRVLVETVNSVVKRRFGECIYSRMVRAQNREMELRYLAFNANRHVVLLFLNMRVSSELTILLRIRKVYKEHIDYMNGETNEGSSWVFNDIHNCYSLGSTINNCIFTLPCCCKNKR